MGPPRNLLTYSVRAPEGYKAGDSKRWPTIVILHGSNMNGKAYVDTIAAAWPDIARDYLILGINGEIPSDLAMTPGSTTPTSTTWAAAPTRASPARTARAPRWWPRP